MSRTLNKVMIIGNVGRDPELKHTPSGIPVTSFRIATSETWKDREGTMKEHTDWHTVVAWRGLAEVINRLVKKGSRIYIEGRLQTRTIDDKGLQKKHVVEILAESMLLLDTKRDKYDGRDYTNNDGINGEESGTSFDDSDYTDSFDDDNFFSGKSQDIPF
ncbi:MAG: single-stranded DNA-binding protein [Ignavibacteriae bacterium HGW-Ignavibacteriae-1]|jgi:single-strand DNA-binding protein|nr:MAG: single-stranded DNA-binding protein [Ignavibacteriae bacterium HGW-Ignavibacteriae-1]